MANWFTQFKGPGGGSGMQSYRKALDAGYSPQQIAAAAPNSGLSVGWRLADTIGTINAGSQASAAAAEAQQVASAAKSQSAAYEAQLGSYRSQLDDYSRRFDSVNTQYQNALSGKATAEGQATEWEGKWKESQGDYEAAKNLADTYKEEAVSRQLAGLQTGRTAQGGQDGLRIGLDSGVGAISKASRDKEDALSIEKKISAEDSVLSRTGPVVAKIGGSSAPSGTSEGKRGLTSGASGGSYYSSRFG